ncbi:MAG: hypothetical protein BMS9Abin20_0458 [Acidimicrobiia bacterium]|nr:MAG: hypothetical protein BMS9Abin20_0458 [Acidimicrobiia bacterium]
MTLFHLTFQFDVVRRVGWADEELGDHIDTVIERLRQADGVRSIEAEGDLNTGRTNFTVRYMTFGNEPEHHGRVLLGVAIRSCGAAHNGLLSFAEEAAVKPQSNQWSGLRTPSWNVRQVTFGLDPGDA